MSNLINAYALDKYKDLVLIYAPKHEPFKIYDLLRSLNLNKREFLNITDRLLDLRNYMISENLIEFAPKSNLYVKLTPKGREYSIPANQSFDLDSLDFTNALTTNPDSAKNITNPPKEKAEIQKLTTLPKVYIGWSKRLIGLVLTVIIAPTIFEKYKNEFVSIWDIMVEFFINLFQ